MTKNDRDFIAKSICFAAGAIIAAMPGVDSETGGEIVNALTKQIIETIKEANEADKQ